MIWANIKKASQDEQQNQAFSSHKLSSNQLDTKKWS